MTTPELIEQLKCLCVKHFGFVIVVVVASIVVPLNIYLFKDETANNTISASVTSLWHWNVALPLFSGGLYGHWCSRDFASFLTEKGLQLPASFFFTTIAVSFVLDIIFEGAIARYPSIIWVAFGFPIGFFTWQMAEVAT
tara:strand:+ start:62281 stop:62697 length:417 start_codon:yes stop_codon:yes gene_type:complete